MDPLLLVADHLEDQGLDVSIWSDTEDLYDTPDIDRDYLRYRGMLVYQQGHAALNWTSSGLRFYYISPSSGIHLAVAGAIPLYPDGGYIDLSSKTVFKVAFVVMALLTVLLTLIIGLALSRWMAHADRRACRKAAQYGRCQSARAILTIPLPDSIS